jgi:hypothetical protein
LLNEAPKSSSIPKRIVKPEVVKPENQTKSEEAKSISAPLGCPLVDRPIK